MVEEHDLQLQSAISAINDVVSRIDSLHDLSEIGSIIDGAIDGALLASIFAKHTNFKVQVGILPFPTPFPFPE